MTSERTKKSKSGDKASRNTLYAYVIGDDFTAIAEPLLGRFDVFIATRDWICPDVWAVNQRRSPDEWELGLNLDLPNPYHETAGWFSDVEAVVRFCVELRREFALDFAIGISDNRTGIAEDIIEVNSEQPDYDYLRKFIGDEPPASQKVP